MFSFSDLVEIMLRNRQGPEGTENRGMLRCVVTEELSRGGKAAAEQNLGHISVDPEVLSGEPAVAGTRIHAMFVGNLAYNGDAKILLEDYGLNAEQIKDALKWKLLAETYPEGGG